ncbi:MAG: pyridoxal-phosphate dependent enzyme [Candidatus Aminicenantes bacterium]|nr:pyridoxal-phosphate dependent enzyme [Candidatus Aminicenantes bacterium]
MKQLHIQTPLLDSMPIGRSAGCRVWLKLENTQPTATFKIRGIGNLCQHAKKEGIKRFISSSGGNAGYAAAYAGRNLGVPVTVFVPGTTPRDTIAKIEEQNAEVLVKGDVWDETHEYASGFAGEVKGLYISPFDHPRIWDGHASVVDEIVGKIPKPDTVIVSVGGGGLLCGVIEGLHRNDWNDVPVVAVETEGTASLSASLAAGKLVTLDAITGIAKSLGAKTVTQKALDLSKVHKIQSVVVSDHEALSACLSFADDHRFLVEPACGASLAIPYYRSEEIDKAETVVVIVCGGIGVDFAKLQEWKSIYGLK